VSDLHSDLLTQEVDEEVRRERMHKLWKTYRKYVFGTAAAIVIVVAGREIYQYQVKTREEGFSTIFSKAADSAGADGADVLKVWQEALPKLKGGYHALAEMRLAKAAENKGDVATALKAYDNVIADDSLEQSMRDLAELQSGLLQAGKGKNLDDARSRLSLVAVKGNAWYFSAQEQLALIDLQQGNLKAAHDKISLLADDAETPQSIKARANELRSYIEARMPAKKPEANDKASEAQKDAGEKTGSKEPSK